MAFHSPKKGSSSRELLSMRNQSGLLDLEALEQSKMLELRTRSKRILSVKKLMDDRNLRQQSKDYNLSYRD